MPGLNYELSQLKVRGDTTADRSLKFLKPSLTLDIKPGDGWHAQLIARRTVAQLDFFDFISAAELSNDRVNGGNANLQPQRAWEFRVSLDHPLFKTGLIKLDAGYRQHQPAAGSHPDRGRFRRARKYRHRHTRLCEPECRRATRPIRL